MMTSPDPLEEVLAHCPEPIFAASPERVILRVSGALERLLGPGARAGTPIKDILHSHDLGTFEDTWARLLEGQEPVPVRCRFRDAEGRHQGFLVALRRAPESGNVYGSLRIDDRRARLRTQVQLLQTILAPALRSRNPERRKEAIDALENLAAVATHLKHLLLIRDLRQVVG